MSTSNRRSGPIAFFLGHLPICFAITGAGVAFAPWPLFYATVRQIQRIDASARALSRSDVLVGIPGGPLLSFTAFTYICGVIGAALILAAVCLAIRERFCRS